MARFTPKVLRLLSEELTGTVLREIDALFSDNGVSLGPHQPEENDPGERRERMRRYLVSLDLNSPPDHAKLMGVYSDLLRDIARRKSQFDADALRDRWVQTLTRAGFEVDLETYVVSDPSRPASLGLTADALAALSDPSAILDHLARLGDTVETDPRLAVSTAKALIESTAKSVLTARGVAYTKSDKVPALVTRAQTTLALSAKGVSDEAPALRQILQSLVTLAQAVTEIRNQVGVDHGTESVPTWVRPRHARLVVGAAQVSGASWCWRRWRTRMRRGGMPRRSPDTQCPDGIWPEDNHDPVAPSTGSPQRSPTTWVQIGGPASSTAPGRSRTRGLAPATSGAGRRRGAGSLGNVASASSSCGACCAM